MVGTILKCADNSGAKELKVIGVEKLKTRLRRIPSATVGDMIIASVKKGTPEMRRQVVRAIIIRQRKPFRRMDGTWVQFEDNAAIIVTPEGDPKGTEVRGPIAKEAADRFPKLAALATMIL
jgi:large subunit ribosomal protein L14